MTESDYASIDISSDPRHCLVEFLGDLERPGDLSKAISIKHRFPSKLVVDLAEDGGDMITDFINNISSILIASARARAALEAEGIAGANVEYLPIVLRDRRAKPVKEPFFIANILTAVDCFDWDRSEYTTFRKGPRRICTLKTLHIMPKAIPGDAKLFRIGEERRELIIRMDLLERLRSAGCDGLHVLPMGQERLL